jgi:methyl-accepting chemotaxis protein
MIIDAMKEFNKAFFQVPQEYKKNYSDNFIQYTKKLNQRYEYQKQHTFGSTESDLNRWQNLSENSKMLQHLYISNNRYPIGEKHKLDYSNDNTTYSKLHKKYHKHIRKFLEEFGYYDIFLVEPNTGYIVYSVFKELDFSTSLLTGPYKNTNFAESFRNSLNSYSKDSVSLVDFKPYEPSYNDQASFISSPIYENDKLIGVLIFQMPIDNINNVMTSDKKWKQVGLGESGECYLIAQDNYMRNDSRFLIEDKEGFFNVLNKLHYSKHDIDLMKNFNTTIGFMKVNSIAAKEALSGKTGFKIIKDYRKINVLSAFSPLNIMGINWAILSEIDESEAFSISFLIKKMLVALIIIISILIILAGYFSTSIILKPIQQFLIMLKDLSEGSGDLTKQIVVESNDEISFMAGLFNKFTGKLKKIIAELKTVSQKNNKIRESMYATMQQVNDNSNIQNKMVTESSSSITEMAASIQQITQNSKLTSSLSQESEKATREGQKIVNETTDSIFTITEKIKSGERALLELTEKSNEIGKIVKDISDISEQTNLLALNAAIEAARAGEMGKGFAVVADEVRKLANRSAVSAQEIYVIVENIMADMKKTNDIMKTTIDSADSGKKYIAKLDASFETILSNVAKTNLSNQEISQALIQQSHVCDSIILNIDTITNTISKNEQRHKELVEQADLLKDSSVLLENEINKFKI